MIAMQSVCYLSVFLLTGERCFVRVQQCGRARYNAEHGQHSKRMAAPQWAGLQRSGPQKQTKVCCCKGSQQNYRYLQSSHVPAAVHCKNTQHCLHWWVNKIAKPICKIWALLWLYECSYFYFFFLRDFIYKKK